MHASLVGLIRDEFDKGNEITLTDLYHILSKNSEVTIEHHSLVIEYAVQYTRYKKAMKLSE